MLGGERNKVLIVCGIVVVACIGLYLANQDIRDEATADRVQGIVQQVTGTDGSVGERVVNLPEDGGICWLTVVSNGQDNIDQMFSTNSALANLKTQVQYNLYPTSDQMYTERVRLWTGDVQHCVILQTGSGNLIYKVSDGNVPSDPGELADQLRMAISAYGESHPNVGADKTLSTDLKGGLFFRRWVYDCPNCHPRPHPQPSPSPQPDVHPPVVNPLPDMGGTPALASTDAPIGLAVAIGLGIGAILMLVGYVKQDFGGFLA